VRAIEFDWEASKLLRKRFRSEARLGLSGPDPVIALGSEKQPTLSVGLELSSLRIGHQTIPLVEVELPCNPYSSSPSSFWVVQERDLGVLQRFVRRLTRLAIHSDPPLMVEEERNRLWQNTVGFLRSPREPFRRFRIAKKRGVLLLGKPGNGKTMACRWLSGECTRVGLRWRSVSAQEYREAREGNSLGELFHLDRPGIVLFDDFDLGIRNRDHAGPSEDHSTFLSEMDGMAGRCGVVFLFTSNARVAQLDPAFRRPGRIDVIMEFHSPDAALRRRFLNERWQPEIHDSVAIDEITAATDGLSFAEIEELRKLLVLDYLATDEWNWPRAWRTFNHGRGAGAATPIGFSGAIAATVEVRAEPARELIEAKGRL